MKLNDYCESTSRTKSWFEGLEADTTRSSILFRWDFHPDDDAADDDGDDDEVLKYGKGAPSRETWDFDARDRQQKSSGDYHHNYHHIHQHNHHNNCHHGVSSQCNAMVMDLTITNNHNRRVRLTAVVWMNLKTHVGLQGVKTSNLHLRQTKHICYICACLRIKCWSFTPFFVPQAPEALSSDLSTYQGETLAST